MPRYLALSKRARKKPAADDGNSHMRYQRTLLRGCALSGTRVIHMGQLSQFGLATLHSQITWSHQPPRAYQQPQASRWYNAGWHNTHVLFSINKLLSFRLRAEVFWDFASGPMINPSAPSSLKSIGLFRWLLFVSPKPNKLFLSSRSRLI